MKKILSLLSVMTISATTLPTTIAASPYEKQENKLENNKTNFLESNDTENLKRNKREIKEKIHFYGFEYGGKYTKLRGIISLQNENDSKKILFVSNENVNDQFHTFFDGDKGTIYEKIIIKDQNKNIIKYIEIHSKDTMKSVIQRNNLESGIYYQDDYIIEIFSKEGDRTFFKKDNENDWKNYPGWDMNWKFRIKNNKLVSYYEKCQLDSIITKTDLKTINQNNNIAILNELNYLNTNLDISQLEITNKTNTSAIIKAKSSSKDYNGNIKIYYLINNNSDNKIININDLIRKGIFLNYRDRNIGKIKEIKNIDINNLTYSNVTATKNIEPIYTTKNNKSICFGTTILFNGLEKSQKIKTPNCKYTKETTLNTQITKGLNKEETNSKTTDMKHNWSFELGINVKGEAGVWPFAKVSTEIETKIGSGGEYGSSETKTLSNKFDFSNSKTDEIKESLEVELPSQEIEVKPNQKIKVTASLDEVLSQVTLSLIQKINGTVNVKIIILNNEEKNITLSIKEIMQKLQQYFLLPQEITINNDDSITFNGKANRSLKQGFNANIQYNEIKN